MKTLEDLLRLKVDHEMWDGVVVPVTPDFRVSVQDESSSGVRIIVHPIDHNGDTLDLLIKGNKAYPVYLNRPPNPPICKHGIPMDAGCKECGRGRPMA